MPKKFESICAELNIVPIDAKKIKETDRAEFINCITQFTEFSAHHASTRKPGHVIHIGFVDSNEFNAWAATWGGEDFIAINWGVLDTLRNIFERMVETSAFSWLPETVSPSRLSKWLYECGKFFVFLHELAHIWNGHTSLLAEKGIPLMQEIRSLSGDKIGNIDLQTMEMDADGFAAANSFILGMHYGPRLSLMNEKWEDKFGSGGIYLVLVSFVTYSVFSLFDSAAAFEEEERTHPAPALRQYMISHSLIAKATDIGAFTDDNAISAVFEGAKIAEKAYAEVSGRESNVEAVVKLLTVDGLRHASKLLRNWHSLRPPLDELKRGGVLPPLQEISD